MRATRLGLVVILAAVVVATPAAAHGAGSAVIYANGSFRFTPVGSPNYTFHAYLSSLGLPIGPGDTLRFSWMSNGGSGPPVYFEIHSHPLDIGYVQYYNRTADVDNDSWAVPGSDAYMVYWVNEHPVNLTVTYAFALLPPPLPLWPFAAVGALVGATIVGLWILSRRSGKHE